MGEGKKKTWQPGEIPKTAKVWSEVSEQNMKKAQATPAKVQFSQADMGLAAKVHGVYEETRSGMEKLLGAAVTETAEMGKALEKIEQEYAGNREQTKKQAEDVGS